MVYCRMSWTVQTLNQVVVDELDALPADMRARFSRIVELIETHGLEKVREPLVKHLASFGKSVCLDAMEFPGRSM